MYKVTQNLILKAAVIKPWRNFERGRDCRIFKNSNCL